MIAEPLASRKKVGKARRGPMGDHGVGPQKLHPLADQTHPYWSWAVEDNQP